LSQVSGSIEPPQVNMAPPLVIKYKGQPCMYR